MRNMKMIEPLQTTAMRDRSPIFYPRALLWFGLLLAVLLTSSAWAETVILHLKNGDQIGGEIIYEDTNHVVVTSSWAKKLDIPASEIDRREPGLKLGPGTPPPAKTVPPATLAPAILALVKTNTVVIPKPKNWKIEARAGADFLSGVNNQQIYSSRFKYSYAHPYLSNPKHSFRNVLDYSFDYGTTQIAGSGDKSTLSANRMFASDKTDFDYGKGKWFVYDLAGAGYDELRKIDVQYEIGPGIGYHLISRPNLLLNSEIGVDYQEQHRADNTTTKNLFFRISQDSNWKINHDVTFSERFEFLPRADSTDFRARAESTLSYALWRNVSLHLSLLDLFDTAPAKDVAKNDLQIHTSIGISF